MAHIESVEYSKRFLKGLSRLPKRVVDEAQRKERLFKADPFDPKLKLHKLHGKESELWAFWIDYRYRIKVLFLTKTSVLFVEIGTHSIYK